MHRTPGLDGDRAASGVGPEIPFFTAEQVERLLPFERAMDELEAALRESVDPERDDPRLFSPAPGGEFLLMPAQGPEFSGLKALTVAPGNPARGLEKIQGLYLLFSSDGLAPIAVLEGASLTAIRTPAVTVSAIRQLAALAPDGDAMPAEPRILIIGAGTQARSHLRAAAVAFPGARFRVVGRRPERAAALVRESSGTGGVGSISAGDDLDAEVTRADIIVCATTASEPLFAGSLVRDGAVVAAIGTHGRALREVDDALVSRSDIVVEGRGSAERENGNLVSLGADAWRSAERPANLRDLALGRFERTAGRPALYTGVGMSWEDLVCASAVVTARAEE